MNNKQARLDMGLILPINRMDDQGAGHKKTAGDAAVFNIHRED